ncbi:acyl-CoA N-acyltransferase [Coniochaeta ligniaria NRRL 30616]|uniref:Acyl-CoA N-acyltransferase n=1 Tax=Coniochaeta ligniaria NRRL 30616 TaxID=1408157 RepID=A0A1J7JVQ7_9PEZI|nr:acyl-CoA N-acyltransferase [Coniochaeta ligniaria NRRL 30616]
MFPESERVSVKTTSPTRPLPPSSSRPAVTTERLIIRALVPEDAQAFHVLRTQAEVMANSAIGRVDKDLEETRSRLAAFVPPNDENTFHFAICLKETGEMIGVGGCHNLSSVFGWPELGYMLREELWGQGLATEFVRAWLNMWCELPRTVVQFDVHQKSAHSEHGGDEKTAEAVIAYTTAYNVGSQKVLEKSGFQHFLTWSVPDRRNPAVEVDLYGYRYFPNYHAAGKEMGDNVEAA